MGRLTLTMCRILSREPLYSNDHTWGEPLPEAWGPGALTAVRYDHLNGWGPEAITALGREATAAPRLPLAFGVPLNTRRNLWSQTLCIRCRHIVPDPDPKLLVTFDVDTSFLTRIPSCKSHSMTTHRTSNIPDCKSQL